MNQKKSSKNPSVSKAQKKSNSRSSKDSSSMTTANILAHVRPTPMFSNNLSHEEKIDQISQKFSEIMEILGLDLANDSLRESPRRIAKMYVNEIFSGLQADFFPRITVIENEMDYDQMVVIRDIQVLSVCEHHFQTIDGFATVAYIPRGKVIGLSKINRIVQFFSRRPQVQERLTKQIADCLQFVLGTEHVAVHISARHYCVIARGVQDAKSSTATSDIRGDFKENDATRMEFFQNC